MVIFFAKVFFGISILLAVSGHLLPSIPILGPVFKILILVTGIISGLSYCCGDGCDDAFTIENDIDSRSRLKGDDRYILGGSWNAPPCKVTERHCRKPELNNYTDFGFRLARSVM